jgi:Polysaccharide pyruvyl transferase.
MQKFFIAGEGNMDNQKIGIITFHAAENFGSALQAFALEYVLQKKGYQAEIINFIFEDDMAQYQLFRKNCYRERPKAFLGDILYLRKNIQRKCNFSKFRKKHLKITRQRYLAGKDDLQCLNCKYDIFICGSDQIWNLNCTNGFIPEYFLDFVNENKKKIAYAPSMPAEITKEYHAKLLQCIERFTAVSVRERQTVEYLQKEIGVNKEIIQTLDPTLLLDEETYKESFHLIKKDEKYIFVYILLDSEQMQTIIDFAADISRSTGLKIRYIFMRRIKEFSNGTYIYGIGPIEFLQEIYSATYVITNSFHATVFSVQFEIPFCVFPRSGSKSRITELITTLKLQKNLYPNDANSWRESKADIVTKEKIRQLAEKSMNFLLENIS